MVQSDDCIGGPQMNFNELKTLILSIIPKDFEYLSGQKTGGGGECVNSRGCLNWNKYGIS